MTFDTTKSFRTNEEKYNLFVAHCKLRKKNVYERINELIFDDIKESPYLSSNKNFITNPENADISPGDNG